MLTSSCLRATSGLRKLPASIPALPVVRARRHAQPRSMAVRASAEKTVLVPIANGSEEMEAVITIDVLRRAGAKVIVASVESSKEVTCSRGVRLVADQTIADAAGTSFDLIACPGGMPGAERLRDSAELRQLIADQRTAGRHYAAICATPAVFFEPNGFLAGKRATSHPAFSDKLSDQSAVQERVVVDGNLTTSRGPGTAFEFALSLVEQMYGKEKAQEVAGPMVMYKY